MAANYSCDAYGASGYSQCATTTSSASDTSGVAGLLANTGYDILIPIALALAVIVASIIYLIKQLRVKRAASFYSNQQ